MFQPGFKLRRNNVKSEEVIQKNLQSLKQNIEKKRRAQAHYYNNQPTELPGSSPLIRNVKKEPVHQRLGQTKRALQLFNGTHTSSVPPKQRKHYRHLKDSHKKRVRIFSAQQRLNQIRQKHQAEENQNVFANGQFNNPQQKKKTFRLRRNLPSQRASDIRVELKNTQFMNNFVDNNYQRFKIILSEQIQNEIRNIQQENPTRQVIVPFKVPVAATRQSLDDRFSNY